LTTVASKHAVRKRIEDVGIIPCIRGVSPDDAEFAAGALTEAGIPIVEITMTVPGAVTVIRRLVKAFPDAVIGAGSVLDRVTARACVDAGAMFLSSPCFDQPVVEVGVKAGMLVLAGALTATEVNTAWNAGADLIKIFPCGHVGAANYIRSLRGPFPDVPFVAAGGIHQSTAGDFVRAGVTAIGIGTELVPKQAVEERQVEWIAELARRFLSLVSETRADLASRV
jgi:2-dehydro-3-deoxyphosphogluconate aldolase/(4S)-4-hydroxy-2-oxoglutarate aldolase